VVQLVDSSGEVVASYSSAKSFSSLVFSSEEILAGEEYQVVVGGTQTGTVLGGYSPGGNTAGAASVTAVTGGAYQSTGMGGGFGGGRPGDRPERP
jgi:hypothetical protein